MHQHWLRTSRSASLTRLCALGLVVLATLPFTAPFAAIDVADLFGIEHPRVVTPVVSTAAVGHPSQPDDADDVLASDACIERSHPAGFSGLVLIVSPIARDPNQPPMARLGPATRECPTNDHATPVITLRV